MDLMGSDALQSEDAMREMWGDSMKAVKCHNARITYDDFLLLMKGQSKDSPSQDFERDLGVSVSSLLNGSQLYVLPELPMDHKGESLVGENILLEEEETLDVLHTMTGLSLEDVGEQTTVQRSSGILSAPGTPAGHTKSMLDVESPLSIDGHDNVMTAVPGVPGSAASLTPPATPERGARDYITPSAVNRNVQGIEGHITPNLILPGLSVGVRPDPYSRRRSRSVDDKEPEESGDLQVVADVARHMIVPETGHNPSLECVVKDSKKSALMVNRQLYRAHRQMRLAVLEASKRFEEQQAKHARDVILAQRNATDEDTTGGMIQAGLVMRHGHKKQVSSEAIRKLLQDNQLQQQVLVEKANRRGGRGRRSRKKTISDMSGMLGSSMGQDEMGTIAKAAAPAPPLPPPEEGVQQILGKEGQIRGATVPGSSDA